MKRLLIATFLVIVSVTIFAVTDKPAKVQECPKAKPACCLQKQQCTPEKTDYIFWEPVNRLMVMPIKY
jgi:hypothetical protein